MSLTVAELRTMFTADVRDVERGLDTVRRESLRAGQQAGDALDRGITASTRDTGSKVRRGVTTGLNAVGWLGVGGLVGAAIGKGIGQGIRGASDLNESVNQINVLFGKSAGEIQKWSKSSATSFGLSRNEALRAAAGFGDMFIQLGAGQKDAARTSERLVQMAADLGSFKNLDTADVVERMSAAFRGEYDSLQQVIPNINAARVEQVALAETGKKAADSLTAQEKAHAAMSIIAKDGARAMNDFSNTQDQVANASKTVGAQVKDLEATFGKKFLPVAKDTLNWLSKDGVPALESFGRGVDRWVIEPVNDIGDAWADLPDPAKDMAKWGAGIGLGLVGALATAKKLHDVMGTLGEGASVLTGGRVGGKGAGAGVMTVRAGMVNVYGPGGGNRTGGPTVIPGGGGGGNGKNKPKTKKPKIPTRTRAVGGTVGAVATAVGLSEAAGRVDNKAARAALNSRALNWGIGAGFIGGPYAGGAAAFLGAQVDANKRLDKTPDKVVSDAMRKAYSLKQPAYQSSSIGSGWAKEIAAARDAAKSLPKELVTKVTAPGAKMTAEQIGDLSKRYKLTPRQVETLMAANIDAAQGRVTSYLTRLGLTPDQVFTAMNIDTSKGTGPLSAYLSRIGLTPKQKKTALTSIADLRGAQALKRAVDALRDKTITLTTRRINENITKNRTENQGTSYGAPIDTNERAAGGWIVGPGGPREDRVPAMLSNGEFVVNAAAAGRNRALLEQVNAQRFANGGPVGSALGSAVASGTAGVNWQVLTRAWLVAAQATTKAARETTDSTLASLNAQKSVADITKQLNAKTKGKWDVQGLDRTVMQAELKKAQQDAAALRAKTAAERLLGDTGSSVRDKTLGTSGIFGGGSRTASQLYKSLAKDVVTNQQFAGIVAQLAKQGLSKGLLDQFTAEGASAASLALGKSILATGNIGQLNSAQVALAAQATQAGYQAQGLKAPGTAGALVAIDKFVTDSMTPDEVAERLFFKAQQRGV